MICVRLMGGIGNQLFQYAFARHIEELGFHDVRLDIHFYTSIEARGSAVTERTYELDKFQTVCNTFNSEGYSPCSRILYESEETYNDLMLVSNDIYLMGYWQDLKYYHYVTETMREECKLKPEYVDEYAKETEREMKSCHSASLHIRRTDYLNEVNKTHFACCSLSYYQNAVNHIERKSGEKPVLYIFSDDRDWAREHMEGFAGCRTFFVDSGKDYLDMYLMSQAKHHIIANSTFSWWAAFVGHGNDTITIAPERWYVDAPNPNLYLPEWKVMA